jgi:anti-sigma regulatory factor (Ser/Thr protein kinase)
MGLAARRVPTSDVGALHFQLILPTDLSLVGEAVEAIVECCRAGGAMPSRAKFRVRTVAAEALANAMTYGNANDVSRRVTVDVELVAEQIVLGVTDEGAGFDPGGVPELEDHECHEATRGRGLFMIRRLSERVTFNAQGNTIWMTLPRH